jgi:O-antigen ligase
MEAGGHVSPPLGLTAEGPAGFSARMWLVLAMVLAAGAGVIAATEPRLALDLALLVVGVILVLTQPMAVLLFVLVAASRHSPLLEILTAASCVALLPRLPRAPGKALLIPLVLFLLFALPGVRFSNPDFLGAVHRVLVIPGLGWEFLTRPSPEFLAWIRLGFGFGLALLAALTVTSVQRARLVFGAVILSGIHPVLLGLSQLLGGKYVAKGGFNSVQGPFDFPNEFGFFLVIVLVMSLVGAFELRRRSLRIGSAALALATLVVLQHTYTRSAWIGAALALLILAVFHYRRLVLLAVALLAVAVVAAPSAVESVQARFGDLASQNASNSKNSLEWRRGEWARMSHFGDEKPLTGQGFGSYQRLTVKEFGFQDDSFSTIATEPGRGIVSVGFAAHNDYVKLYVETGVPGVVLWIIVLAGLVITAAAAARVPELRPWAVAVAALGVAFALMSASDNIQGYAVPLAILFALTGALAGAHRGTARPSRPQAG